MTVECSHCGRRVDREKAVFVGPLAHCPDCRPETDTDADEGDEIAASGGGRDFTDPEPGVWPEALLEREQWMGHVEKNPFAPWGDADPDDAAPEDFPRWEWGRTENHVDGDTIEMAEEDPRLDGRVFLQRDADPFAFVDGDDVRCPETGDVHPEFIRILDALGATYTDVSTSGSGVHANYRGDLPDGVKQADFQIDTEPWGANDEDDLPSVEIYDGKHVCVATGDHVPGTPTDVRAWDADALEDVLDEYDQLPEEPTTDREEFDLEGYDPDATDAGETTDDIRDLFAALDRLDARRVAGDTIVRGWNDNASTSDGKRAFHPTWGGDSNGSANVVDREIWQDTGDRGGYGGPAVMAAIDCPDLTTDERATPRDVRGADWMRAVDHLRDLGYPIPELETRDTAPEEYRTDPREVEATVDARRAWDAAGRVTPEDLDADLPELEAVGDVARAVALAEGMIDDPEAPLTDAYPEAYRRAREAYGAPLPEYYTTADAIAEFDAVLDVIGEVTFWHLDTDALESEITAEDDDVDGEAVRALNPAWRESESGESVLVFESGAVWDADTERVLDALRFVALDTGLIDDPGDPLEGEAFTTAYDRARRVFGAPLPRWEPATDGAREITPQLPSSEALVEHGDLDGVDTDELEAAREDVEALLGEALEGDGSPTVVTSLPATGKTTAAVKLSRETPLSYLAPRKELQQQALDKADRWGADAEILPVFSEERVRDDVLDAAVSHVRDHGTSRLRDRWAILAAAREAVDTEDDEDDLDPGDIFTDDDPEDVDLDRATCDAAEGEHGVAWALVVHVARRLGYTPREIHENAAGLFGVRPPCCHGEGDECPYSEGWDDVTDADDPPDLLIGSYVHAHVESVRTAYDRGATGDITRDPRPVVLDEYPGEAFVAEYDEEAIDFATWLARCLREDVADRRDMHTADLGTDPFVKAWLDGRAGEADDAVADAIDALGRTADLLEAREEGKALLAKADTELLEDLGVADPLDRVTDSKADAAAAYRDLRDALDAVPHKHPAYAVVGWVDDDVREPLARATVEGATTPTPDTDADALPVDHDLAALVERAVEAARGGREDARAALEAATTAIEGGEAGCRQLAAWADDGYAHPDAHHFLTGVLTRTGEGDPGDRVHTDKWAFDADATDGTVVDAVETTDRDRVVLDRNDHGALLQTPPARTSGDGEDVPLVGLDATGRAELWGEALNEPVDTADIHDTPSERAAFLEDALGLRVLQASDLPRPYEGDPTSKDTDGDAALLEAIDDEYAGVEAPRQRGEAATPVGSPAAITTKGVRELLEADRRLEDVVAEWENFGNLTGANDLGEHRLGAILGSQHYGDDAVERFAALAGEEVDTDRAAGRGGDLDYGNDLGNAYLRHMRDDQVMQAALRFTRGESGATVVARTSALREDLPVVGEGQVAETWSDTATEIARAYRRLGEEFTIADVRNAVDVTDRQVRRVLSELADAGYIHTVEERPGVATTYEPVGAPGAGEADLPDRVDAIDVEPGQESHTQYYTWNVRVSGSETSPDKALGGAEPRLRGAPPARAATNGGDSALHDAD